jgi:hypothetical protein
MKMLIPPFSTDSGGQAALLCGEWALAYYTEIAI